MLATIPVYRIWQLDSNSKSHPVRPKQVDIMPVVTNAEHDIACSCSYKKRNTVLRIVTGGCINSLSNRTRRSPARMKHFLTMWRLPRCEKAAARNYIPYFEKAINIIKLPLDKIFNRHRIGRNVYTTTPYLGKNLSKIYWDKCFCFSKIRESLLAALFFCHHIRSRGECNVCKIKTHNQIHRHGLPAR